MAVNVLTKKIQAFFFFKGHGEENLVKVVFAEIVPNGISFSDFESKS